MTYKVYVASEADARQVFKDVNADELHYFPVGSDAFIAVLVGGDYFKIRSHPLAMVIPNAHSQTDISQHAAKFGIQAKDAWDLHNQLHQLTNYWPLIDPDL